MDMLPLVPAALLVTVGVWLVWPVMFDPILRARRRSARAPSETTEAVAEALFVRWAEHGPAVGLASRRRDP